MSKDGPNRKEKLRTHESQHKPMFLLLNRYNHIDHMDMSEHRLCSMLNMSIVEQMICITIRGASRRRGHSGEKFFAAVD